MERWQKIEELFQLTIDCAESDRAALLTGACAGDESLREEVESLLTFHERSDGLIDSPAVEDGLKVFLDGSKDALAGSRLGPYKVIREISRGGMGAVYLAARANDYEKRVAIKLIKRGMDTDEILGRFRNERQILASLDHPNIARLLDGGTTEEGLPYFVMEYIEGQPVDEYCNTHCLSIDELLHLFRSVCAAVSYAHQHLVIHRDLKPGNILVTDQGAPKLLDFGIAKLLDAEASAHTVTALRVMTPEYASPEQIRGAGITTASDVYSLGVVLYELLSGRHPYHFKNKAQHEIAKVICETEPEKPSEAVSRTDVGSTADGIDGNAGSRPRLRRPDVRKGSAFPARAFSFLRRGYASEHLVEAQPLPEMKEAYSRKGRAFPHIEAAEPKNNPQQKLNQHPKIRNPKLLRGDLDNIVLMAMRKEPERRYASVAQFSEDIRRHLEGLPVVAHKDTLSYRSAKFVARHKTGVAAALLIMLALVIGIITTARQARIAAAQARLATEQRDRARFEAAKAERINAFMQTILAYADPNWYSPGRGRRGDVKVIEALNETAGRIDTELADQPEVRAELHHTVGTTYHAIGLPAQAEEHFRAALMIYRALYGEQHPKIAESLYYLGAVMATKADYAAAESMWRQAIDTMRAVDKENVNLPYMLQDLGGMLASRGNAEGEPMLNEALKLFQQRYGEDHITVVETYNRFGLMYEARGDLDRAQAMFEEALVRTKRLPEVQANTTAAAALGLLGRIQRKKGEYVEAEALYHQSLDLQRQAAGDTQPSFANTLSEFASLHSLMRDYAKAEAEAGSALEIYRSRLPEENPLITGTLSRLGVLAVKAGQPARARSYLREALKSYRTAQQKGIPNPSEGSLGELLFWLRRYAEAEPLLIKNYDDLKAQYGEQHPSTAEARHLLARFYEAWNKPLPNLGARQ